MKPRLLLEPEAEAEFLEAAEWYEKRRPGLGGEFGIAVDTTLAAVEEGPERFPVASVIFGRLENLASLTWSITWCCRKQSVSSLSSTAGGIPVVGKCGADA